MRSVRFRPAADDDFAEIQEYIGRDNPIAALRFVESLQDRCHDLADHPNMGRPENDLAQGLRALPSGNYVIFYSVTDSEVIIERVIHGRRDLKAQFT